MSAEQSENFGTPADRPTEDMESTSANTRTSSTPAKRRLSLLEFLVILAIVGVLVGLLLPAVQSGDRSPRRTHCLNNQKQISLALLCYESDKGHFPPAFIADKNGKPMHSWRVLILPYLERNDLYEQYDFNEPWDGPHNRQLADKMPRIFACPSNQNSPNCTDYAILVGPHAVSAGPTSRSTQEISAADGTSNTLLLVEAADAKINWLEPRDLNVEEMAFKINQGSKELSSRHANGVTVSFCDGHQSFLSKDIAPETLKALTTVDGKEPLDEGEF